MAPGTATTSPTSCYYDRYDHEGRYSDEDAPPPTSITTLTRFESGSNRDFDQAPSIHVVKSRRDYGKGEEYDDCSVRSFQHGMDPIERDWGDSQARGHGYRDTPLNSKSRHSVDSVPSFYDQSIASPQETYRKVNHLDDYDYGRRQGPTSHLDKSGRSDHGSDRDAAQRSLNDSSGHSGSDSEYKQQIRRERQQNLLFQERRLQPARLSQQPQQAPGGGRGTRRSSIGRRYRDEEEAAQPSRPDTLPAAESSTSSAHSSNKNYMQVSRRSSIASIASMDSSVSGRRSSISGSSAACPRSAPVRRTPIPREPSIYRKESSDPKCSSQLRTFSYHRRASMKAGAGPPTTGLYYDNYQASPRCDDYPQRRPVQVEYRPPIPPPPSSPRQAPIVMDSHSGDTVMVEIAPGTKERLRGTEETYAAVSKDFYDNVSCFGCSLELCCIADVAYVICPECEVIGPLEGSLFEGQEIERRGLGLGFTYESLFQMQVEIMKERSNRS